ncbi:MAG: hypothetical protein GOU99_02965, partial [Candidatus Altiarchaeota archaeon]|nr:hypothetical protein [Candidatus Altiarchaeota archaeon]
MSQSTFLGFPLTLYFLILGIVLSMISWRLMSVFSNPEYYADSVAEEMARRTAMVCSGTTTEMEFSPPPPGMNLKAMTCQEASAIQVAAIGITVLQLADLASSIQDIGTTIRGLGKGATTATKASRTAARAAETADDCIDIIDGIGDARRAVTNG